VISYESSLKPDHEMSGHEISDGTYRATIGTYTDGYVTFVAPACDPAILITPENTLPHTDLASGESITITIVDGTVTGLEDATE
jgi:hypothetical protein